MSKTTQEDFKSLYSHGTERDMEVQASRTLSTPTFMHMQLRPTSYVTLSERWLRS